MFKARKTHSASSYLIIIAVGGRLTTIFSIPFIKKGQNVIYNWLYSEEILTSK